MFISSFSFFVRFCPVYCRDRAKTQVLDIPQDKPCKPFAALQKMPRSMMGMQKNGVLMTVFQDID